MARTYDAIVIGTGQAGPSLAAALAGAGMNTAIIERHRFGGTCVNVGCIPTKALVASARAAHVARRAADFGVVIDGAVGVDMARVKARKDAIARKSEVGVERWLRSLDNCTVYQGHARFEAAHRVRVGDDLLEAERIFINVGARAFVPPFGGLDQVDYLTNSTILDLEVLPEHLIIVGGGYIGLEFAQMYRRFGSQVTLIETGDRLIKRESPDISAAVTEILEAEGVRVRLNAQCIGVGSQGDAVTASVDCTAGAPEVVGSHLLLAVGRRPNTDDLGLDAAGIEVDRRGLIPVDETLQTAVPGVWALGECNGRGAFTHTAYNDYEIVSANLLHDDPRSVADRIDCYALYIDPPLGRVGMTEQQVRESGRPALIATRQMTRVGRAVEKSETQGFMKVLVDAESSRILGAAILGVGGDEVIHSILDVMYAKAPYTVIQRAVHIHPTVAELIPTMLADLKPLGG
jgi:pyruvate/2-oxoglutarate dehydrogenase complex dihydrolipoamide dehydrogenase (E3) component